MADITASQAVSLGADAVYLKNRPPPIAPTGYYDWQITTDPADDREGHSAVTNLVNRVTIPYDYFLVSLTVFQVQSFEAKGGFKPNPKDVDAFIDAIEHPTAIDDRKGAFATGLGILARLDPQSDLSKKLNNSVINTLYTTVPHPPASYLGPEHSFRQADGGGNNLQNPDIGRAGRPYSRSVQGKAGLPRTSLPDSGLIFDTILKRKGMVNHSGGMSSLIFAFAAIVTHSLFRTDHKNIHINNASSYLDLSPLYGDNQEAQDKVRDKASGRGLLYPDTFSEERLLFLPPATSVLLVLFSRNHNYIAEKILKINERKLWSDPPPTDPAQRALQDEQIFQTARLVNGGYFMSAIMGDYVAGFLGSSEGCNWNMNAFDVIQTPDLKVERGLGNHVSVEFNVLYRWHATTSARDQKWTEDVFNSAFGGKPFDQLSLADIATISKVFDAVPANPAERTFFGLKRGPDGKFSDDDLAEILKVATENPAGAFRGRGTPEVLRLVEIMGIEQSRAWGVCTMNEFRKFLGLKPFVTFEDWNPDPEIASAARRLYGHVDNLELYTGLQAESTMPLTDGSRFACGYTTTRGVLGDAIALVRGDRFYTSEFTPINLTTWGFYDCQRDMNNGAQGGIISKLILRHLPRHFPWNSVYSLFPFFTPSKMKTSLTAQKLTAKYTFDRPKALPVPKILNTFTGIKEVWSDPTRFKVIYEIYGYGSILMFDDIAKHDNDRAMVLHALFPDKDSLNQHAAWIAAATKAKIQEKSWGYNNVAGNVTFLAFDEPEKSFALHEAATQAGTIIGALSAKALMEVYPSAAPGILGKLTLGAASYIWPPNDKPYYPFLSKLAATGRPLDQLLGNILGIAVGASVNWAHAAVNVVDFYLDASRAKEKDHIVQLVAKKDAASAALLRGYVSEAMRLKPQFAGLWREAVVDASIPQGPGLPNIEVKAGDRIRASFRNAHLNPLEFPDPTAVNPNRPAAAWANLNGMGFHNCPGTTYSQQTIAEIVKAVFSLKNVRRAPGDAGKLQGFSEIIHETETDTFVQRNGTTSPWPGSLIIAYDE
ncbi:hypothetical protein H0H81_007002 [Sphagnurus paluster]|uniref:Heme peroxidase n=1 Tax=Sphagnurus paluster TaxID=117069 RepID=A0A9P7FR10_9AGAR|nr:hypothetical protein H0H81_007002 [Sphagnurus paluster]